MLLKPGPVQRHIVHFASDCRLEYVRRVTSAWDPVTRVRNEDTDFYSPLSDCRFRG
jgi:hypothetical protein